NRTTVAKTTDNTEYRKNNPLVVPVIILSIPAILNLWYAYTTCGTRVDHRWYAKKFLD
ncbi:Hypothetical protein CINCED_3A005921, partial [Cinara cedri]